MEVDEVACGSKVSGIGGSGGEGQPSGADHRDDQLVGAGQVPRPTTLALAQQNLPVIPTSDLQPQQSHATNVVLGSHGAALLQSPLSCLPVCSVLPPLNTSSVLTSPLQLAANLPQESHCTVALTPITPTLTSVSLCNALPSILNQPKFTSSHLSFTPLTPTTLSPSTPSSNNTNEMCTFSPGQISSISAIPTNYARESSLTDANPTHLSNSYNMQLDLGELSSQETVSDFGQSSGFLTFQQNSSAADCHPDQYDPIQVDGSRRFVPRALMPLIYQVIQRHKERDQNASPYGASVPLHSSKSLPLHSSLDGATVRTSPLPLSNTSNFYSSSSQTNTAQYNPINVNALAGGSIPIRFVDTTPSLSSELRSNSLPYFPLRPYTPGSSSTLTTGHSSFTPTGPCTTKSSCSSSTETLFASAQKNNSSIFFKGRSFPEIEMALCASNTTSNTINNCKWHPEHEGCAIDLRLTLPPSPPPARSSDESSHFSQDDETASIRTSDMDDSISDTEEGNIENSPTVSRAQQMMPAELYTFSDIEYEPVYDEYEPVSDNENNDLPLADNSDSDIDTNFAVAAVAAISSDSQLSDEFADQSGLDSDAADLDELDMASFFIAYKKKVTKSKGSDPFSLSSADSDFDPDFHADRWKCLECNQSNNRSFFRYCEKCWKMRRCWLPDPPKKRKKRKPRHRPRKRRSNGGISSRDKSADKTQAAGSDCATAGPSKAAVNACLDDPACSAPAASSAPSSVPVTSVAPAPSSALADSAAPAASSASITGSAPANSSASTSSSSLAACSTSVPSSAATACSHSSVIQTEDGKPCKTSAVIDSFLLQKSEIATTMNVADYDGEPPTGKKDQVNIAALPSEALGCVEVGGDEVVSENSSTANCSVRNSADMSVTRELMREAAAVAVTNASEVLSGKNFGQLGIDVIDGADSPRQNEPLSGIEGRIFGVPASEKFSMLTSVYEKDFTNPCLKVISLVRSEALKSLEKYSANTTRNFPSSIIESSSASGSLSQNSAHGSPQPMVNGALHLESMEAVFKPAVAEISDDINDESFVGLERSMSTASTVILDNEDTQFLIDSHDKIQGSINAMANQQNFESSYTLNGGSCEAMLNKILQNNILCSMQKHIDNIEVLLDHSEVPEMHTGAFGKSDRRNAGDPSISIDLDRCSTHSAPESVVSVVDSGLGSSQDFNQESSQDFPEASVSNYRSTITLTSPKKNFTSPTKKGGRRCRSNASSSRVDVVDVVVEKLDDFSGIKRKNMFPDVSIPRKKRNYSDNPITKYLNEGLHLVDEHTDVMKLPENHTVKIISNSLVEFLRSDDGSKWMSSDRGRSWMSSAPVQAMLLDSLLRSSNLNTWRGGSFADNLCIMCQDRPKDAAIIHGKISHQATCYRCAKTLFNRKQRCPVCRRKILRIAKNIIA